MEPKSVQNRRTPFGRPRFVLRADTPAVSVDADETAAP